MNGPFQNAADLWLRSAMFTRNPTPQSGYKWVSVYLLVPSIRLPGVSWSTGPMECPFFWMTSIFSPAWEKKQHSFGFELQLDPWPLSLWLGYQNTQPSARDCRASAERGVNIIHLESRIQTAIICYSHTHNPIVWSWSRNRWTGASHILRSVAAPPFLSATAKRWERNVGEGEEGGKARLRGGSRVR